MRVRAAFIAGLAMLACAAPAQADVWNVTNGSSDATTPACNQDTKQCVSLRTALAAAEATKEAADTINVPAGTININNDLVIQSDITVVGTSARTNIIDGGAKSRGFRVTASGNAKISHFTIRNGAAVQGDSLDGGGILNLGGTVVLDHVRVTASRADNGGGIANYRGNLALQHSLVDNNTATGDGGGVASIGGPEVPDLDLLLVTDSTVFRNTAAIGGTGGISSRNAGSIASVSRSTVADNIGGARGIGGLALLNNGKMTVTASIAARNLVGTATSNCGAATPTDGGATVENEKECGFDVGGTNPALATALANQGGEVDVLAITAASPAVDLGPLAGCSPSGTTDQRKLPRPQGPGCDAGAFELEQAPTVTINSGPTGTINFRTASFNFSTPEPGVTVQCRLNGPGQTNTFTTCEKPTDQGYSGLPDGSYTFSVRALDGVNASPPTTTRPFVVDATFETTITGGPTGPIADTTPTFTFTGSGGAASFQCRVDAAPFATCASPHTTAALGQGNHTFEVRALTVAGEPDPTPASRAFTVDTTPPNTTITVLAPTPSNDTTPSFSFTSSESGSSFQCRIGTAGFAACTSPFTSAALTAGPYTFEVRATDAAGNVDQTPAQQAFVIDTTPPNTTLTPISSPTGNRTPSFTFSSEAGATFQCRVDTAAFASCTTPHTTATLADGTHTFQVRALDAAGNPDVSPAEQAFEIDTGAPETTLSAGPSGVMNDETPEFAFSSDDPDATFQCRVDTAPFLACTSPFTVAVLAEGAHIFEVKATDRFGNQEAAPATRSFTVDLTPPAPPAVVSGPEGTTTDPSPSFAFAATETVSCRLEPVEPGFGSCISPKAFSALAPGSYVFVVRSVDAAGNASESRRPFTVTVAQGGQPTPTPTPSPSATPTPTPPAPTPQTVVVAPAGGTILVRLKGSTKFEPLDVTKGIPFESEVDARKGKVRLTSIPKPGAAPESADFFDGLFTVHKVGDITELRLSEKLTGCPKASKRAASAAQKKPKSRKLWGDGKGKFRTKGQYSAATVRGTKWLVQDTCTTTLTRVTQGVVAVNDFAKKKTFLVKKNKRYTARPKKR